MNDLEENTKEKNSMMPIILGAALVIALAAGAYYFTQMRNSTSEPTANIESTVMEGSTGAGTVNDTPDTAMELDETQKTFEIEGANFKFSVPEIKVKKGDTVKIVLTTTDNMQHDWRVDELDVSTEIVGNGETTEVTFVADKAGEFEYYCSVGQHRANGMLGKFIVEE